MKEWSERKRGLAVLGLMVAVFAAAYALPFDRLPAGGTASASFREALLLLQDYAREHVLLCLVPALFIAGAIACFVSQGAVMKYFGPKAHKAVAYTVAAVSGTVLAACSCTILPLFAGIYTRGAGLGPATAFLYAGPAINVLAIILTARVLGWELGVARAVAAVLFSVVIGLTMHLLYRKEEAAREVKGPFVAGSDEQERPLWQTILYFAVMIAFLVFVNWKPLGGEAAAAAFFVAKLIFSTLLLVTLIGMLLAWFTKTEFLAWMSSTWVFAKQILPLLFIGVLLAGFLLGRPGHPALIPERWIAEAVGGNGIGANFFASFAGALMYFATLTEVPILDGLLGAGMGRGPALALLLAGPALSLPNMLVIRSVMGTKKTIVYVSLVVVLSTVAGLTFGAISRGG